MASLAQPAKSFRPSSQSCSDGHQARVPIQANLLRRKSTTSLHASLGLSSKQRTRFQQEEGSAQSFASSWLGASSPSSLEAMQKKEKRRRTRTSSSSSSSRQVVHAQIVEPSSQAVVSKIPEESRARLEAKMKDSLELQELQKPLGEYMTLPASQYSVLDAARIERVDSNTFRCYAHRLSFFSFEVGPVLLVRVEERPDGCCIRLLSCELEGSPIVVAQNNKFAATMTNTVSYSASPKSPTTRVLTSETSVQVILEVPPAFSLVPKSAIEGTGSQVLQQLLRIVVPRFLQQLAKDYKAWASGDATRKALGTGEL